MPIEFRCSQCGKLLRTADDTAGRSARCPECGQVQPVPAGPTSLGPQPAPIAPDPPESAPASPFGTPATPASPFGPAPSDSGNPYQAPGSTSFSAACDSANYPYAWGRVQGPAIALMVTAIISMPLALMGMLGNLLSIAGNAHPFLQQQVPLPMISGGVGLVLNFVGLAVAAVILFGAIRMKNLQNYGYAMTAAIIAMIPCVSPCCLLGLPFGIWALVVLSDPGVRAAFR